MESLKEQISHYYTEYRYQIEDVSNKIHSNPELSEEETFACDTQCQLLEQWQFKVERNYKGLDTAFNATFGEGHPNVCIMSEYDALPEIGHGCGHNLITGVALGTGIVLKKLLTENSIPGRVTIMGTPAEEKRGCKIDLIKAGALEDVDLVMMAHPSDDRTSQSTVTSGLMQYLVNFEGRTSHAAVAPEKGLNALDAVRLLFNGVDAWRQQLPESCRIHGIILDGGKSPNIIPDTSQADFYLRSFDMDYLLAMKKRFRNIAKGAALMTDTRVNFEEVANSYKPGKPNDVLNKAFIELAKEFGMNPEWTEPFRGSSDFGDVTYEVPAMHAYFNITDQYKDAVIHSKDFAQCAASPFAYRQMGKTSRILAQIGHTYFTKSEFRNSVKRSFPFV
ncbi:MAG: M20 family metallopeptidase [Desulfobacula sp.]|nr:M20 family metallopeptidase [Desulfobacula sp.]